MTEVYHATLMPRSDAFLAAGESLTHAIVHRVRASTLTMTSGSSFTHPDTGVYIFAGFLDVDLEMVRRFPELRHIDQLNLIIIGTTPRVYIVPKPDAPKR
jgi:hypothetical protein